MKSQILQLIFWDAQFVCSVSDYSTLNMWWFSSKMAMSIYMVESVFVQTSKLIHNEVPSNIIRQTMHHSEKNPYSSIHSTLSTNTCWHTLTPLLQWRERLSHLLILLHYAFSICFHHPFIETALIHLIYVHSHHLLQICFPLLSPPTRKTFVLSICCIANVKSIYFTHPKHTHTRTECKKDHSYSLTSPWMSSKCDRVSSNSTQATGYSSPSLDALSQRCQNCQWTSRRHCLSWGNLQRDESVHFVQEGLTMLYEYGDRSEPWSVWQVRSFLTILIPFFWSVKLTHSLSGDGVNCCHIVKGERERNKISSKTKFCCLLFDRWGRRQRFTR